MKTSDNHGDEIKNNIYKEFENIINTLITKKEEQTELDLFA